MQIRHSGSTPPILDDLVCYYRLFSETTGERINYIAISGGSFCILPGLLCKRKVMTIIHLKIWSILSYCFNYQILV